MCKVSETYFYQFSRVLDQHFCVDQCLGISPKTPSFLFLHQNLVKTCKNVKKQILTSVLSAQHSNTSWNIQQSTLIFNYVGAMVLALRPSSNVSRLFLSSLQICPIRRNVTGDDAHYHRVAFLHSHLSIPCTCWRLPCIIHEEPQRDLQRLGLEPGSSCWPPVVGPTSLLRLLRHHPHICFCHSALCVLFPRSDR